MASIEPFNRLIKLAARAFYDTPSPTKGETPGKNGRGDNAGINVVVLDALTRRQWVRDDDLAKDLKLHAKQLRRTLRFFEEEKLVTRDHRKETTKGVKLFNNAAAAFTGEGQQAGREGDEKIKMHTHSYSCLDYAQIYDVVRYRLHRMKKKLKDELESKNTIQEYVCPNCSKRYTAFDALRLVSPYDEYFHCESCNGVLAAESDKLAAEDLGDGDDNARRRRHEKIKDMLMKMEEQLKPLVDQLARVKDLPVPEFGNLQAWELRANSSTRSSIGELNASDPSRSTQGLGFGGTPMPYVGETQVEVAFSGIGEKGENATPVNADTPRKILPPWMIKEGMSLTTEQRGEPKKEIKVGGTLTASDDKKSTTADDEAKKIHDEYIKAYYAALLIRQREQEEMASKEQEATNAAISNEVFDANAERQIGMKSKRDDDYATGGRTFKVMDLNMEAEPSDEEEEDIDWEEG